MGSHARKFIRNLALIAHEHQTILSKREIIERITEEIAIAVQRGNARIDFVYYNSYCPRIECS